MSIIGKFVSPLLLRVLDLLEAENRPTARILQTVLGLLTTILTWSVHLTYPFLLFSHQEHLGEIVYPLVLAPTFVAIYSVECLLWPDIAKSDPAQSGPMSGYLQLEKTKKRRNFFFVAAFLSAVNLLCMMFTSRQG
ncbi:MAG TPA: hypothetical protein VEN79_15780 [Terriglobia bacterium]|nr:hypothetical protein [Terriglobia bacterium]